MIVCPSCGRPTEAGWTTCLNCGKALIQSRVRPGETLPGPEMPAAQPVPQYQQQQYQQQPYQRPRKSCFGRFIGWLILAVFLWYLFTHLIPAFSDLHYLFDGEYTSPQEVGAWFARLNPFG